MLARVRVRRLLRQTQPHLLGALRAQARPLEQAVKARTWGWADRAAHFLYCPGMCGKGIARARWHHHIHLIPGSLLYFICDRYDLALGVAEDELDQGPP